MKTYQITAKFLRFWLKYKFNFIDADGYYWYQCVDLIRAYCKQAFWYVMPSLDKARNLSNKHLRPDKRKEIKVWEEKLRMWDIMSVDLIPQNKYWHIFIVYKETDKGFYYVDQNWIGWAGKQNPDWIYPKIKWNWIERRFASWSKFKILKAFRYA